MALYSAKEAKWYRRNVERREHCQFFFFITPPLLLPPTSPRLLRRVFRLDSSFPRLQLRSSDRDRSLNSDSSLSSSLFFSFLSTAPLARDLPQSTSFSLPKVRFNYITCCSCQATRGYKTYASQGCACGTITSTNSITRSTIEHSVKVAGPGTGFECQE